MLQRVLYTVCYTPRAINDTMSRNAATYSITLHHTASHCITLHHNASHCNNDTARERVYTVNDTSCKKKIVHVHWVQIYGYAFIHIATACVCLLIDQLAVFTHRVLSRKNVRFVCIIPARMCV